MSYGIEVQRELAGPTRALRERIPEVFEGYMGTRSAVMTDGSLDVKTKELIALAISVSKQCDGCIASHARGAAREGATADEVAEAIGVAILMDGGPGTVHGARAMAAFEEFASPDE